MVGTASEVVGITLETKPRRKSKRNVLFDMTASYRDGLVSAGWRGRGWQGGFGRVPLPTRLVSHRWQARGSWQGPSARDAHMLLQNELFLNVATKDWEEGELRGQVISLPYSGLLARYTGTRGGWGW